jgi:hypothetical protein
MLSVRVLGLGCGVSNGPNDAVGTSYALSLAVLAFAVEDMNARDCVITPARPWAFLNVSRREFMFRVLESNRRTSDPDTTRPILQVLIPGCADFGLVHHLVVVRCWMRMLQIQFRSSRNPLQS